MKRDMHEKHPATGLRFIYMVFVGLLVATFVGFGVATFYTAPQAPEYPLKLQAPRECSPNGICPETAEEKLAREQYDQEQKIYQGERNTYERNTFIIILLAAVIILVISLTVAKNIDVIADGLLLGGTLTLFYGIIRSIATSEDTRFRFIAITVGLLVTLVVGYMKFIKQEKNS